MLYLNMMPSVICVITKCVDMIFFYFFFFKQKTAYEMRISDWSSDVCFPISFGKTALPLDRFQAHNRREPVNAGQFGQIVAEQFVEMIDGTREQLQHIVAVAGGRVAFQHGGMRHHRGFEVRMRDEADANLDKALHLKTKREGIEARRIALTDTPFLEADRKSTR